METTEYDDPILYDQENDAYTNDVKFLSKWAGKTDGPIIDLACGTGRATIPLALEGHKLIGVDLHSGMLNEAKKKSAELNLQIQWIEQDCTELDLPIKSNFIYCVGNSFQHFLTNEEQDKFLASVHQHLQQDGIFIFCTRFPNAEELLQPETEEYWRSYIDQETKNTVDVYTISNYDPLNQIQHYTTIRKHKSQTEEIVHERRTNISLRYVFPKEMERLLTAIGFEIIHVYGDWSESPLTKGSNEMVYVCRKI
jgi:ubiquinone/menaquinone biosynthesis C-methylase UbiE